jgi:hypothetical protein
VNTATLTNTPWVLVLYEGDNSAANKGPKASYSVTFSNLLVTFPSPVDAGTTDALSTSPLDANGAPDRPTGNTGIFTNWTSSTGTTASGTLGASSVTLTTDKPVYGNNFPSPVVSIITNGTFTGFNTNYFTPSTSATDTVELAAASSFTLTFQPPVTDPTLHIYQLADNTLSFSSGTTTTEFALLSSDGTFTGPTGSRSSILTGTQSLTDSSGSLSFNGTFSQISWDSDAHNLVDGLDLQISLPVPGGG